MIRLNPHAPVAPNQRSDAAVRSEARAAAEKAGFRAPAGCSQKELGAAIAAFVVDGGLRRGVGTLRIPLAEAYAIERHYGISADTTQGPRTLGMGGVGMLIHGSAVTAIPRDGGPSLRDRAREDLINAAADLVCGATATPAAKKRVYELARRELARGGI